MITKPSVRIRPSTDLPAQFAAPTDNDFTVIGEPRCFICKPADDYLPQPGAVLMTGITSREARVRKEKTKPLSPDASSCAVYRSKTCVVG